MTHRGSRLVVATSVMIVAVQVSTVARQATPTEIVVADRYSVGPKVNILARRGFRLDALAVPETPLLPQNVVVVLSRRLSAAPSSTDYRVVSDVRVSKVEGDVNALAAKGYVLKGVTLARSSATGPGVAFVAALELASPPPEVLRQYRLAHTRGTPGDWQLVEQAGRDGYDVIDVITQAGPTRFAADEVTFVCEKRADGAPVAFTVKSASDVSRLGRDVNDLAASGQVLRSLWSGTTVLSALLSRASTTASLPRRSYDIDADPLTVPSVNSMSGRLVSWVRFRGEQVEAFDRSGTGRYEMVTDPVPDEDSFRNVATERARDRIDRFVRKGYRAVWARYARDDKGALELSVILEQMSP